MMPTPGSKDDKEQLELEELRGIYESLKDISECAVCLHPLRPDTVLCVNGHAICKVCQRGQATCPTCRKKFSNVEKPAFIRKVLELIPHSCRNEGCTQTVEKDDDHENYCSFRPTNCKGCKWQGPVKELKEHWIASHPSEVVESRRLISVFYYMNCSFNIDKSHGPSYTLLLQMSMGHHFLWVENEYNAESGIMTWSFSPVLDERPGNKDFFVRLLLGSNKKEFIFGIRVELVHTDKDENKIYLPVAILNHFMNAGELKYRIDLNEVRS